MNALRHAPPPTAASRAKWAYLTHWPHVLRCLLIGIIVQATSVFASPGELTAFTTEASFAFPEAAWGARSSFRKITKSPEFLGWAKGPRWILLQSQHAGCAALPPCYVYFGPHPVARYEAWAVEPRTGQPTLVTSGGAALAATDGGVSTSPRVIIPWAAASAFMLVRIDPITTSLVDPRLVDAADLSRQARNEGWLAGAVLCFLLLAFAIYAHNIYRARTWKIAGWLGFIVITGTWFLIFNTFISHALEDWTPININRLYSGFIALILISSQLQLIFLFNIHEEPAWIRHGLRLVILCAIPACFIGEMALGSSLQGLLACASVQIMVFLFAVYRRHTKGDPDATRLLWLGGALVLALELHFASFWGIVPYSWLLHYAWRVCLGLGLVIAFWDGWMGNDLERRLTRARKARLQKLLLEEKQKLEIRVDERTAELQVALSELRQMEQQQRRLLALASHEFRTPATIIKSSLDVLDVLPDLTSEMGKEQLSILRNASTRLTFLANKLIDHDRWREMSIKPQLQHLNLSTWLTSLAAESPPNINLISRIPPEPIYILGDVVLLRIALQNLIDNAIIHSKANGPVTLHLMSEPDQAFIVVDDQGTSVPDEHKATVFDRFFSSGGHGFGQTHGLGLSIVKSIMHLHHGHASCEDAPGGGARFKLILPRSDLP